MDFRFDDIIVWTIKKIDGTVSRVLSKAVVPGDPLTYFNDEGVRRIFLGLTFWPKGIFWGL